MEDEEEEDNDDDSNNNNNDKTRRRRTRTTRRRTRTRTTRRTRTIISGFRIFIRAPEVPFLTKMAHLSTIFKWNNPFHLFPTVYYVQLDLQMNKTFAIPSL